MKKRLLAMLLVAVLAVPTGSGLLVQAEDTPLDVDAEQVTETVDKAETVERLERIECWDFAEESQLSDFSLSNTGTNTFVIENEMLSSNGTDGEMKAFLTTKLPENTKEISVDIIPKEGTGFDGGLFIGNIAFLVKSNYSGWTDAPNRIDLTFGTTSPSWEKIDGIISETGKKNNLYTKATKVPLTLKITLGEDLLVATIFVKDNESKFIQKIYEIDSSLYQGQIGVVANETYICYDNLTYTYEDAETENLITGLSFDGTGNSYAGTNTSLSEKPKTIEAWVKMNPTTVAKQRQAIISNYTGETLASNEAGTWGLYTDSNGKLWWTEKSEESSANQVVGDNCWIGEWMHVALVRSTGKAYIYINGELIGEIENDAIGEEMSASNPLTIGYCTVHASGGVNSLNGEIGDIRLWSIERTQAEIRSTMYSELTGEEEGLTNLWTFDEQAGTIFHDKSGDNHGTLEGARWNHLSKLNIGLSFAGTGEESYAKTNSGLSEKPKTIEAWVKMNPTTASSPRQAIISNYTEETLATNSVGTWGLYTDSNGKLWWTERSSNSKNPNGTVSGNCWTGEWMHVALVRSTGKASIYVNGEFGGEIANDGVGDSLSLNNALTIGYCTVHAKGGINSLNGEIGEIRLWSTERTQTDIQNTMYSELTGKEEGLTNLWTFDEQQGTTFADSAGTNDGVLMGATWSQGITTNVEYLNEGYQFSDGNTWQTASSINATPHTLEAWVKIPRGIMDSKNAMIISNSSCVPTISMEMYTYGRPRLYWKAQGENAVDVIAPVDLRTGEWTHVAFSCDVENDTVICYINGELIYTQETAGLTEVVMPPSIVPEHHFYIGNVSSGAEANRFLGWIADARMWSRTLSQEELTQSMMTQYTTTKEGLLLNVSLSEKTNDVFSDLSGNDNHIKLYERELNWIEDTSETGDYSIVVIPDQQILTNFFPDKLNQLYQWIADNAEEENVQMVLNLGDIVDICAKTRTENQEIEWERAKEAFELLPDNLPFIAIPGNHDYDTNWNWGTGISNRDTNLTLMNKYFPLSIFQNYPTESGSFSEDNGLEDNVANTWQAFEVNGNRYLILALECNPADDALEWANDVVESHPEHQVIVMTHNNMGSTGELTAVGEKTWDTFASQHENIIMVLSGHISADNIVRRFDQGIHGNQVVQMLMDGQSLDSSFQGYGMLGIMRFNAVGTECKVSWYSPLEDKNLNETSQFTLTLPEPTREVTDKFTGMTLNLEGKIAFNFYVSKYHTLSENAYVEFELPRTGKHKVLLKEAVETSNGLKFSCMIPAKEMADTIVATLYDGETVKDTKSASIQNYAEIIINNDKNSKAYTAATPLMKAMLHYGSYAQTLFNYNTSNLVNANYKEDDKVPEITAQDLVGYTKGYQGLSGFGRLAGATLVLEGETTLRMFFEFEENTNVEGLKFIVNGTEKSFTKSGNYYIVESENIGAKDLDLENQVVVMVGEETKFVASCSAMTFCYNALKNSTTSEKLQNVAKALYLYNGEANRYMEGEVLNLSEEYDVVRGTVLSGSNRGFSIQNKQLVPPGATGEGKAIVSESVSELQTVSVDIYPGESNFINSAIYLGATEASDVQDSINAMSVIVQSNFVATDTWTDAPNRIDLIIGAFPKWTEYHRFISETGSNNALFTNGEKQPLNLKVDIENTKIKVTLSLKNDPTKSVTTEYTYAGDYDLTTGQVGLRSQYDDSRFDNFAIKTSQNEKCYTFDDVSDMSAFDFYHSTFGTGITASTSNALALHKTAAFINGTLSAELNTNGDKEAGIVFGADADGKNYYLYRLTSDRFVELVKVEDGTETILDKGFLSAGHINTNFNRLEVVKEGNSIYCYYDNRFDKMNCYAVYEDENPLSGTGVGLWSATAGTVFQNVTCSNDREIRKADVLIFGHSYTEMWWDFETYFPEYESIDDIGIGGSVAVHWESLADEVIAYEPELGIYNIGINDLTGGTTPKAVVTSIEKSMLAVKEALPEFEVVLVSVSHCPARSTITAQITETNALMRNLAASYDWMYYAEAEYLFCTDASDPLSTNADLFIDGLHPSAEGYQLLATSIKSAIKGENQPVYDETLAQKYFEEAKSNMLASLGIYSEHAYTAENWTQAEEYYNAAVSKINACTTEDELEALDLSTEIAALNAITNKSVDVVANLLNADNRIALSADTWTKTDDNTINVNGYSYALDKTATYSDMEAVFSVSNNTGNIATGGIFLRATAYENNGIKGYLVNYVSSGNYMQVYYLDNVYNTAGSSYTLQYIGGVAFGTYGDVVGTDFHVKIEGDKLYLSTLERYQAGEDPLAVVDLTYNGTYEVIQEGYFGGLAWNNGVSYDLNLKHFKGE